MFNRKRREGQVQPVAQQTEPRANISVGVPISHIAKIKSRWVVFLIALGMFTQYLMAVYTPEVWNAIYTVLKRALPVL